MTMREQAAATVVDLFRRDQRVAIVMADISLELLRPAAEHDPRREALVRRYGTPEEHDRDLGLDIRGIRDRVLAFV
jgi:hypothetical protein